MNSRQPMPAFAATARWGRLAAALTLAGLLAACAGTGGSAGKREGSGIGSAGTGDEAIARGTTRGGGYYLDDGPGNAPPPDLDAITDAVPRAEPVRERNSRPYVVFGRQYRPMARIEPYRERGVATWYGRRYHGNATSSGERYDMYAMTAAHPTLPIPSYARVTNLENQRSVVVRVNDRGPFLRDRLIDLSYTAAAKLGYVDVGSARVEVELITEFGDAPATPPHLLAGEQKAIQADALAIEQTVEPIRLTMSPESPPPQPQPQESAAASGAAPPVVAGGDRTLRDPAADDAAAERLQVSTEIRVADSAGVAGANPVPELERAYWLQLGAFGSTDNADAARQRLLPRLTRLGAPLDIVADGGLFKLQAGPWPTREAARAAADHIRAQTELQPFTMQR